MNTLPPNIPPQQLAYDSDGLLKQGWVGKTRMFEDIRAGRLKARKMGTKLIFLHDDVMAWLSSLPERETSKAA